MDIEKFNSIVLAHRDSMILIGSIIFIVGILAMIFLEVFTRERFTVGKIRFPAASLLLIPIVATVIYFSTVVIHCNRDVSQGSYEEYIGSCVYKSETVTLSDIHLKFSVGLGHDIVPPGESYGRCIYSKHSKVIVYWEEWTIDTN